MVGETILHYRIIAVLGSGGMGVVYDAQDLRLHRPVALKFLPRDLAGDPVALERLQREARAASILNHPYICTIYAIERDDTADGPRHFLAMERLDGQTLDRVISGRPLPLDVMLDLAIQIADALDAAHGRGVVHRDIKPSNIFVQPRHRVKILDFGLAKAAASRAAAVDTTTVDAAVLTSPGVALGTVAYMSPEQARGDDLDARTDLFSFGAVLYEMCTGRPPFAGKTSAVIFQQILDRAPDAPRELNPALPPRLNEIILKALEKDRELRSQTAAELRADLRRLRRDSTEHRQPAESGARDAGASTPVAARTSGGSGGAGVATHPGRQKAALVATLLLALLTAAGFGMYSWLRPDASDPSPSGMTITRLTTSGMVVGCTSISPDGRYVVYCENDGTGTILRLHQIATGATITVVEDGGLTTFSPDGNLLYIRRTGSQDPHGALWVVPSLGGSLERVITGIVGSVAVSPDGQHLAFMRNLVTQHALVVANRDGTNERTLASGNVGEAWFSSPFLSWSPDGRLIAAGYRTREDGLQMAPVVVDVGTGEIRQFTNRRWPSVLRVAWLPDGSGVVFVAPESFDASNQMWLVSYPGGEVARVTNDLHHYGGGTLSVSHDGTIVAGQFVSTGNLWVADSDGANLTRVRSGNTLDEVFGWTSDRSIVFETTTPEPVLFMVPAESGAQAKRLSIDLQDVRNMTLAPDGTWAVYHTVAAPDVWRVNFDGTGRQQLTRTGHDRTPRVTPDGAWIM